MRYIKTFFKRSMVLCFVFAQFVFLAGCNMGTVDGTNTKIIISMGFAKDEIFRLDTRSCSNAEILVYLACLQMRYEEVFGSDFWSVIDIDGTDTSIDSGVKENVLARISQIKAMNLLAESREIELSVEEDSLAQDAAIHYFEILSEDEKEYLCVTEDILYMMYKEYALANKVYEYLIKDINPEISDDEARTITVEHIFLRNYSLNGLGEKITLTQTQKNDKFAIAESIIDQINAGESFEKLIEEYNEDEAYLYSFGKGEMELDYEEATFALASGEISDIIETEDGYYIFKCLSSFDKEETQENKIHIIEERKKEVFEEEYKTFVNDLPQSINQEAWDAIQIIPSEYLPETTFFSVYNQYFN